MSSVGEKTGPVTGPPPPLSSDTKSAIADAASSSTLGAHVPGQDAGSKVKSEKECT
jgi:valyl-tRNA synthetase